MTGQLGKGTFGVVVRAQDNVQNKTVAIKITNRLRPFRTAAAKEWRVLNTLQKHDENNRNQCVRMVDSFRYKDHICIVTQLLGPSVFEVMRRRNLHPFTLQYVQTFARQLFRSVACTSL